MNRRLVPLTVAAAAAALLTAVPAGAAPAPLEDPNAVGYLGFCDSSHHQVRAGSLAAAPFAWTTVASVSAPAGYEKGKASVYAFQPRKNTSPGEWSGKQMAAASTFSSARHPMAGGTRLDASLGDFTGTYPARLDGLVQFRMIFTAPNRPQYITDYPAVFVRVTGTRWTQVDGGAVDCAAGSARSVELDALSHSRLTIRHSRPTPETAAQVSARSAAPSSSAAPSGAPATSGARAATTDRSAGAARPVADSHSGSSSDTTWIWVVAGGVVVLAGGAVVAGRRARARE